MKVPFQMICTKCLETLKSSFIGQKSSDGFECVGLTPHSYKSIFFNGYKPYFKVFAQGERTTKAGKLIKKEFEQTIQAKYCAMCGEEQKASS
jgi:hypothetical protein